MSRLAALGRFWWDFVIGDDWLAAAGAALGIAAWWLLPVATLLVLYLSLRRAAH